MPNIRNLFWSLIVASITGYFIYDTYLVEIIDKTPKYIFELASWTWFSWAGWYALQRISR